MPHRRHSARGRRGTACSLAAIACALAIAGGPARALAEDGEEAAAPDLPARARRAPSLSVAFFDDFLGVPKSRLTDDNGFVASLRIWAELPDRGRTSLRVGAAEQLITERDGPRRVDDGRVYAAWRRALGQSPSRGLTIGWTVGLHVVGDLGGSVMQDWAHRTVFTGRRLGGPGVKGLQDRYPAGYDVLADLGALARLVQPIAGGWSVRGGAEAALGLGTGWFGELHPFVALGYGTELLDVELRLGAGIYGTSVRPLTMPGGYVTGVLQSQPALHVAVLGPRWLPATLGFDVAWNQGDSRQHVGGFTVGARF